MGNTVMCPKLEWSTTVKNYPTTKIQFFQEERRQGIINYHSRHCQLQTVTKRLQN